MNSETHSVPQRRPVEPDSEPWRPPEPDISHLITEDDEPVDNPYAEKLMRLLTRPLYSSWKPGRPFVAMANVGLYASPDDPPIVPDVMLSMDVESPSGEGVMMEKKNRCYMVWVFGKRPDLVLEIVSPTKGGELDRKLREYARIGVSYYVVYDPRQEDSARLKQFALIREKYEPLPEVASFKNIGLRLVEWRGEFEGRYDRWLRWAYEDGSLVPTGEERAQAESARADALAAKLRALGVDPDSP